ncbi:hypothetical protein [Chryseobacterium sp. 2R14A]|uniref:hypothetical protein n=1 Tax=Chryseobacterium sp. 2R14A TaxID=3380353 RepID=UPI003CF5ADCD
MKNNFLILATLLIAISIKSQIAIGKQEVSNTSVSLEFNDTENRGLILPYLEDKTSVTTNGSIIYDVTDHKVKYLKDTNVWQDLSVDTSGVADIAIQTGKTESTAAKAAIGTTAATDTTPGVLVLSDTDKAMILPKVASPHLNIINPAPGMIAYDTVKKQIAVYNGTVWSFWKP